jgi:hypothetical protein
MGLSVEVNVANTVKNRELVLTSLAEGGVLLEKRQESFRASAFLSKLLPERSNLLFE